MSKTTDRIKELRTQKKLTQSELAEIVNTSRVTISRIENGSRNPSYGMLSLIANALHTNTDYLYGDSDNPEYRPFIDANGEPLSPTSYVPKEHQFTDGTDIISEYRNSEDISLELIDLTSEELNQVKQFIKFVKSQR